MRQRLILASLLSLLMLSTVASAVVFASDEDGDGRRPLPCISVDS